jgi:hypothetical protein
MRNTTDPNPSTAADARRVTSETYPDSTYGAVPILDQYDAVDAYSPYDDGGLDTVPAAHAAYVDHHQRQWL